MERLTEKQLHILRQKLCDMKNRCYNPNNKFYKDYGGRGITVCEEWIDKKNGHSNFQKWALKNGWSQGCSIDRIDVNGNYEPTNCRWATPKEQANNRRNNCPVTINGVTKNATEWAEEIGISERSFMSRIKYGWSEERLLEPKYKPLKMTKAEMAKEIREWRKAEEQGLLLRVPVAVGGKVYEIIEETVPNNYFYISEHEVQDVSAKAVKYADDWCEYGDPNLYFTRAEAEQALTDKGV